MVYRTLKHIQQTSLGGVVIFFNENDNKHFLTVDTYNSKKQSEEIDIAKSYAFVKQT